MAYRMLTLVIASFLIIMAITIAFSSLNAMADTEGLVLYLSFEESDTPVDHSPNPAEVSIIGDLEQVNGKFGKAMEFDGNPANYIEVAHSDKLEGMNALTIEAWIKPYKPETVTAWGVVSKRISFQDHDVYNLFLWTEVKMFGRVNANESQQISSETVVEDGEWYHLAYVFDGNVKESERQKMYVNGELESTQSHPDKSVSKGEAPLWVGTLNAGKPTWNGVIDEVRIWNRALSENEVKSAMEGTIMLVKPKGKLTTTWGEMKRQ